MICPQFVTYYAHQLRACKLRTQWCVRHGLKLATFLQLVYSIHRGKIFDKSMNYSALAPVDVMRAAPYFETSLAKPERSVR